MVQSLCGLGLVGGPRGGELGREEIAVGGVGSVHVIVEAPVLDDHSGFEQAVMAAIEAFDPGVLPR